MIADISESSWPGKHPYRLRQNPEIPSIHQYSPLAGGRIVPADAERIAPRRDGRINKQRVGIGDHLAGRPASGGPASTRRDAVRLRDDLAVFIIDIHEHGHTLVNLDG